jgi:putative hydrolase of the HAD superfamily
MGRPVTTVLFDLDDTLCEYRRAEVDRLADAFEAAGVDTFFSTDDVARWVPRVDADSPLDLRRQVFGAIVEEAGRAPAVADRLVRAYEDPDHSNVRFCDGASAALDALAHDYALGLVTNGGREPQRTKLDALDIADAFDTFVFATPEPAVKPDTEPFDRAFDDLGVDPRETVHVGDSLASDVAGAKAAGVTSVWVSWGREATDGPAPDYTVDHPGEIAGEPWRP